MDEALDPTEYETWAYIFAIESYNELEYYGLPYDGGSQDQPYQWKIVVTCIKEALAAAKVEAMADAKDKQNAKHNP